MPILELRDIHKSYGKNEVLKGINLSVERGEVISVLGPSGCGKSTLLNIIAGILSPDQGEVILNGTVVSSRHKNVPIEKRHLNMVFQDFALWPHMTAQENILYGLECTHTAKEEKEKKLNEMVSLLHLEGLMDHYPPEMSGGQQQRVAIARSLINNPQILLLDEPLCNLDVQLRIEMRTEMALLFHQLHTTVFHVTHDPSEAFAMADTIIVMNHGVIDQAAKPQECYTRPSTANVAGLLGAGNIIQAAAGAYPDTVTVEGQTVHVCSMLQKGAEERPVELRFRPQDGVYSRDRVADSIPLQIILPVFEGDAYRVRGRTQSGCEVTFLSKEKLQENETGWLHVDPAKLYAYEKNPS